MTKDKPATLTETYGSQDPNRSILDLTPTLRVFDRRIQDYTERVDKFDTVDFRQRALALFGTYARAVREEKFGAATKALDDLGTLLAQGVESDKAWEELAGQLERRAKRTEEAINLLLRSEQVVNGRDLNTVLGRLVEIIREELPVELVDTVLRRIDREVMEPLARGAWNAPRRAAKSG